MRAGLNTDSSPALCIKPHRVWKLDGVEGSKLNPKSVINIMKVFEDLNGIILLTVIDEDFFGEEQFIEA